MNLNDHMRPDGGVDMSASNETAKAQWKRTSGDELQGDALGYPHALLELGDPERRRKFALVPGELLHNDVVGRDAFAEQHFVRA